MTDSADWIEKLKLIPHPEGGFFREVYRAGEKIGGGCLSEHFDGDRVFSTAIYFFLRSQDISVFHRLRQDELWHFYDGDPLTLHVIEPSGKYSVLKLGRQIQGGCTPMIPVKAGWLFGATVDVPGGWTLAGCTVAPGFEYRDLEMPSRQELLKNYPEHGGIIRKLTRPQ